MPSNKKRIRLEKRSRMPERPILHGVVPIRNPIVDGRCRPLNVQFNIEADITAAVNPLSVGYVVSLARQLAESTLCGVANYPDSKVAKLEVHSVAYEGDDFGPTWDVTVFAENRLGRVWVTDFPDLHLVNGSNPTDLAAAPRIAFEDSSHFDNDTSEAWIKIGILALNRDPQNPPNPPPPPPPVTPGFATNLKGVGFLETSWAHGVTRAVPVVVADRARVKQATLTFQACVTW